jgi:Helix-turn-helix domain
MAKKRRWKKPGDPRVHTAGTRSQSTDADEYFHDILELSSLGTLAARQIRSSTDADTVQDVRQRMSGREAARTLSGEDSPLPGESIRSLSASTGRSYGFVHRILTDSGVDLRRRGGAARSGRTMRITGLAKKAKR